MKGSDVDIGNGQPRVAQVQCYTGTMANLTITVDDMTLKRARLRALERNESVNSYLAEVLRRYADADGGAMSEVIALARASQAGADGSDRLWTRDELHRG